MCSFRLCFFQYNLWYSVLEQCITIITNTQKQNFESPVNQVDITSSGVTTESVNILNLRRDWHKSLLKLYRQFPHSLNQKLVSLLQYATIQDKYYRIELEQIKSICELCTAFKQANSIKTSCQPTTCKQIQLMYVNGLKATNNELIFYLIDTWLRLTVAKHISCTKFQ